MARLLILNNKYKVTDVIHPPACALDANSRRDTSTPLPLRMIGKGRASLGPAERSTTESKHLIPKELVRNISKVVHDIKQSLKHTGFHDVDLADAGIDALDQTHSKSYDLILLDCSMYWQLDVNGDFGLILERGSQPLVLLLKDDGHIDRTVAVCHGGAEGLLNELSEFKQFDKKMAGLNPKKALSPTRAYVLACQIDLYIREHAAVPTISLKKVSRHFNITERYVMKLFQKHIECTFRTRLASHRVELAKVLIAQTDTPLGIIAEKCGFRTQSRLTDAFKRIEGIAPKIFRRNIQKNGDNSVRRK